MSNYIQGLQNHVVFVLDESSSMNKHGASVVTVVDNEIQYLANRSKETDQETRVSVYVFSSFNTARCVIYDMDVLRLPSIKGLYHPNGMTALCDATMLAVNDLNTVPQKYGQHSFLFYVFTDGMENASTQFNRQKLPNTLANLPENWTFVTFVPDQIAKSEAVRFGFPRDNVSIWDTTSVRGMEEVGQTVRKASESFFTMRSTGGKGSKSLFALNTVSTDTIKSHLTPLSRYRYTVIQNLRTTGTIQIRDLVQDHGIPYKTGFAYYELKKRETIQPQKAIIVEHNGEFYAGQEARDLLGLPDYSVMVDPDYKAGYKIFVQSTSVNRNIIPYQRVLYLTGNDRLSFLR